MLSPLCHPYYPKKRLGIALLCKTIFTLCVCFFAIIGIKTANVKGHCLTGGRNILPSVHPAWGVRRCLSLFIIFCFASYFITWCRNDFLHSITSNLCLAFKRSFGLSRCEGSVWTGILSVSSPRRPLMGCVRSDHPRVT